jgi:hypothetical protein
MIVINNRIITVINIRIMIIKINNMIMKINRIIMNINKINRFMINIIITSMIVRHNRIHWL